MAAGQTTATEPQPVKTSAGPQASSRDGPGPPEALSARPVSPARRLKKRRGASGPAGASCQGSAGQGQDVRTAGVEAGDPAFVSGAGAPAGTPRSFRKHIACQGTPAGGNPSVDRRGQTQARPAGDSIIEDLAVCGAAGN